jgi:hypothetical protein
MPLLNKAAFYPMAGAGNRAYNGPASIRVRRAIFIIERCQRRQTDRRMAQWPASTTDVAQ